MSQRTASAPDTGIPKIEDCSLATQNVADSAVPEAETQPFWQVYICNACGLLYDEEEGDADSGLAPGTRFADIPDDWACPVCGVRKDDFVLYKKVDMSAGHVSPSLARHGENHQATESRPKYAACLTRMHHDGVVIVGAGRAGWEVAQALRQRERNIPITLVTGCSGDLYDKPLLSVAHAKGIAPEDFVRERGVDAAGRLQLQLMSGTFASGLTPEMHQLRTTRGSLRYRYLVLAQGARGRDLKTLPATLCWRINDLDTYCRLRKRLVPVGRRRRDVIVVGAGLVGCELANDLALAGHRITLLDIGGGPLSAILPPPVAVALLGAWKELPIRFVGHVDVARISADGAQRILHTSDGRTFIADEIISATGLEVDRGLADSGRLAWQGGIAVSESTLATSAPDVFALGDCITIGGRASRYIEPIRRQAHAIAGFITGIDPAPYVERPSPLRIKTTSCNIQLDGMPASAGLWRIDATPASADTGIGLCMSQWIGDTVQARLTVGTRP